MSKTGKGTLKSLSNSKTTSSQLVESQPYPALTPRSFKTLFEEISQNNDQYLIYSPFRMFEGQDNIIPLTKEERLNLCSNFIQKGNDIIMTDPNTPDSFIEKINNLGYGVFIPPIYLGIYEGMDGVRCHTQVQPKITKNDISQNISATMVTTVETTPKNQFGRRFLNITTVRNSTTI